MTVSRRELLKFGVAAAVLPGAGAAPAGTPQAGTSAPTFCFFSKHLPHLGWRDVARAVKEIGYGGVDLTVRTNGHVRPDRAAADLPRAVEAITAEGVAVPMITTELTSPGHPTARPILEAAARSGVRYFKTGYWHYRSPDVRQQLAETGAALEGLTALAREFGIQLGFHNHTAYVGAALWDIAPVMDALDPAWAGYYFDPRHAVAEGGGGAWKAALHLVLPRLKMVSLKDFFWEKTQNGWTIRNCPLGEGAVDWPAMGAAVRGAGFAGPVSLHFEYDIEGPTVQQTTRRTLEAAARDLSFARRFFG